MRFSTIEVSDGIVLGSPVYIDYVTTRMKTLIQRLADAIHCKILRRMYGCSVSTTHSSGGAEVITFINHVLNWLGVTAVGGA